MQSCRACKNACSASMGPHIGGPSQDLLLDQQAYFFCDISLHAYSQEHRTHHILRNTKRISRQEFYISKFGIPFGFNACIIIPIDFKGILEILKKIKVHTHIGCVVGYACHSSCIEERDKPSGVFPPLRLQGLNVGR